MVLDRTCVNMASAAPSDRSGWLLGSSRSICGAGSSGSSNRSSGGGGVLNSSVARANNSWYVSEHPSEPIDRRRAAELSPPMTRNGSDGSSATREFSTASRLKRLGRRDPFSQSRDPAITGERYAYAVNCGDCLRRDTAALRFHSLNSPEAVLRLPAALNTSSVWIDNSLVAKSSCSGVVPPILPLRTGSARPMAAAQRRMLSSPRVAVVPVSSGSGERGGGLVFKTKGF